MTKLQLAREAANLSRQELATKAGITCKTVYNVEMKVVDRVQERIRKGIVNALGVKQSKLFDKHGAPL
jgi:transcriptional regulator with XRE-family HTH domain